MDIDKKDYYYYMIVPSTHIYKQINDISFLMSNRI